MIWLVVGAASVALLAWTAIGAVAMWPWLRDRLRRGRRSGCRDGYCECWAWHACSDGRCRYHCALYCRCVPIGNQGHALRTIDGGRR